MSTISTFRNGLGVYILRKQNQHFGCEKRPFRPQNLLFWRFWCLKMQFSPHFCWNGNACGSTNSIFWAYSGDNILRHKKNSFWVKKLQFLVKKNCSFFSVSWKRPFRSLRWHFLETKVVLMFSILAFVPSSCLAQIGCNENLCSLKLAL